MTEIPFSEAPKEIASNILAALRERLKGGGFYSQETVWLDTESGSSDRRHEHVNIFVGPRLACYEPMELQLLTDILTLGIKKSRESAARQGPLGISLARVQFVEDLEDKTQVITLIMLPQARYAKISADYFQAWIDKVHPYVADISEFTMHVRQEFIERYKDKEHELEEWASRLLHKAAGED